MPPPPAVVCVPGLGLDARAWRPTVEAFGSVGDVRVAELPGYGLRPRRDDDVRPRALARLLVERWLDAASPTVLLGHSASCQIVAWAAAQAPEAVAALVLVGPTTDPRAASWPRLVASWLATARHEAPGQVPSLVRQYARTGPLHMVRAMDHARRDDIRATLADVGCRVLVLRGRHDSICLPDWALVLAARAPRGSRAETLRAGAHMVPLTHAPRVAMSTSRFLAEGGSLHTDR